MIEIQIINTLSFLVLETQYFSWCLLHFSNSYLSIYLETKEKKTSKTNKQTRQNKNEKKRNKGKRKSLAGFEPGTFDLTRHHIATTPLRITTSFGEKSQL